VPTVVAPDPAAVADAAAAVTQGGAANVSVSVRIGSPGDNGDVSQAITVSAGAQASTSGSAVQQNTATQAQTTQTSATNISISVRIDSPGSNGSVTQTTSAAASATPATSTQYQTSATQYPAPPTPAAPDPAPAAPTPAPQPDPSPAPAPAPTQPVTPSPPSWVWNLTVSGCGDTSSSDITKTIDTGIQGWIWNWNVGTICPASQSSAPVNPPESGVDISSESIPAPDPPTPPSVEPPEVLILPSVPQPAIAALQPFAVVVPVLGRIQIPVDLTPVNLPNPLSLSPAFGLLSPVQPRTAHRHARAPAKVRRRHAGVLAAAVTREPPASAGEIAPPARSSQAAPHRSLTHRSPRAPVPLLVDSSFVPAPGGASAGAGGGGAGAAAAALSLWILLQLPGLASLRLPARQRRPRDRVDDMKTRPG
jgi:hypothetical protein